MLRLFLSTLPARRDALGRHSLGSSLVPRHPATLDDDALLAQVREVRRKAGGPGGQRRNKVATAVHWEHTPSGVTVDASERRSTEDNRKRALSRLRLALAVQHREPADPNWRAPSDFFARRTAGARLTLSATHRDVAPLIAEALDRLAARDFEVEPAATDLGLSTSRLIKLLKLHPPALVLLNRALADAGRNTYR